VQFDIIHWSLTHLDDLRATDSGREGCCWRDVGNSFEWEGFCERIAGDRFGSGRLLLERCGRQVRVRRVVIGEM
jgi:hypothetical protein